MRRPAGARVHWAENISDIRLMRSGAFYHALLLLRELSSALLLLPELRRTPADATSRSLNREFLFERRSDVLPGVSI